MISVQRNITEDGDFKNTQKDSIPSPKIKTTFTEMGALIFLILSKVPRCLYKVKFFPMFLCERCICLSHRTPSMTIIISFNKFNKLKQLAIFDPLDFSTM